MTLLIMQQDPQQSQQAAAQALAGMGAFVAVFVVVGVAIAAFGVFLFWRTFAKAGLAGPLGLIMLIPGVGWIICMCILAFAQWNVVPAPTTYAQLPPQYPPPTYPPAGYPPQGPTA